MSVHVHKLALRFPAARRAERVQAGLANVSSSSAYYNRRHPSIRDLPARAEVYEDTLDVAAGRSIRIERLLRSTATIETAPNILNRRDTLSCPIEHRCRPTDESYAPIEDRVARTGGGREWAPKARRSLAAAAERGGPSRHDHDAKAGR